MEFSKSLRLSWSLRGLPNIHPPWPSGLTVEDQWDKGCLWGQIAAGEQVPAPQSLGPQNLDMTLEKVGTGPEIARQYISTT